MYKLTKQGDFPKGNIFSKEWHVRVNNHLNYIFQIEHNVDYTKNKIKLNHIVLEDNIKIKNPRDEFNLPIDVEGIQFNIIIKNGSSDLQVNQSQIRREEDQIVPVVQNQPQQNQVQQQPAPIAQQISFEELQDYLVMCDSIIENLNQMSAKEKVECIFEQQAIMNNLKERTQSKEYLELIQNRIDNLTNKLENGINTPPQSFIINNQQQQQQRLQQQQQEQLKQQEQQQKQKKQYEEVEQSCIICMDKDITHALLPCGHQKYCKDCAQALLNKKQCALCQGQVVITGIIQIFR